MEADKNDITAMVKSRGYKLLHNRRRDREKEVDGVVVLVKTSITHKQLNSKSFSSFEHTMIEIKLTTNTKLVLITIYRLQFISPPIFLKEFTEFLEMLSAIPETFVLSDINFHLETGDHYVACFRELLIMFNLIQYVNCSTHKMCHTLDLVLARCDSPIITNLTTEDVYLSDHFMVIFNVESEVLKREVKG